MIKSFRDRETGKIHQGIRSKKLPAEIQDIARRKLRMLNNAQTISDLLIPPSNRLGKLSGNLKDYYSIRINNQWRIIFMWTDDNSHNVSIIDYH